MKNKEITQDIKTRLVVLQAQREIFNTDIYMESQRLEEMKDRLRWLESEITQNHIELLEVI